MRVQLIDLGVSRGSIPKLNNFTAAIFVDGAEEQSLVIQAAVVVKCDALAFTAPGNGSVVGGSVLGILSADLLGQSLLSAGEFLIVDCNPGFSLKKAPAVLVANSSTLVLTSARVDAIVCQPTGFFGNSPSCQICPAGFFRPATVVAATECLPCPAGSYSPSQGAGVCLPCPQDTFSPGTNRTFASNACSLCNTSGYTTTPSVPGISRADCVVCDKGFESPGNTGVCTPCRPGTYNDAIGFGECVACPRGSNTFGRQRTVADCLCEVGYTRFHVKDDNIDQGSCGLCPMHTYKDQPGNQACTPCPLLSKSLMLGAPNISMCLCMEGTERAVTTAPNDKGSCQACIPGTVKAEIADSHCVQCEPGTHAPQSQATGCMQCVPGTYINTTGGIVCFECSPGHFARDAGAALCAECALGKYAQGFASTSCLQCIKGTFVATSAAKICQVSSHIQNTNTQTMQGDTRTRTHTHIYIMRHSERCR
jgi:hypothetical protein